MLEINVFQIAMGTGQSWLYSLGKTTSLTQSFIPTWRALHSTLSLDCMVPDRSTAHPSGWLQATELAHLDKDAACMSYLLRGVISAAVFPLPWGKAGAGVWLCRNQHKLAPSRLFSLLSACSCLCLGQVLTLPHEWSRLNCTERGKKEKIYFLFPG